MALMNVLQVYSHWLPVTMNWLYNQVKHLDDSIHPAVYCDHILNSKAFALDDMYALDTMGNIALLLNKIIRKSGFSRFNRPLINRIKETKADVVHSHFGHTAWENIGAIAQTNARHIVTFYGTDVNHLPKQNTNWLQRYEKLFHEADLFLCEGPYMRSSLIKLGCPPEKVKVHHLGVAVEHIPFTPTVTENNAPLRILIAASFLEKKGIPYALEALRLCQDIHFEVTIIGDAPDSRNGAAEKRTIQELADTAELRDKVTFLGYQPYERLRSEMQSHHVFLSPSVESSDGDTEGGAPMGIVEACAAGLFVISTTHCDIPNVVLDKTTGFLAPERDSQALADCIRTYMNSLPEIPGMLQKSRQRMEQEFSATIQGKRLSELYTQIVSG